MTKIYHLALVSDWQNTLRHNTTYFPPTYDADGFTHGTSEPGRLLDVANHFYTDSVDEWICLEMTEQSLDKQNIVVKYEAPANVGNQDGKLEGKTILFPHVFGGIHPDVVTKTYPVIRDASGAFTDINLTP